MTSQLVGTYSIKRLVTARIKPRTLQSWADLSNHYNTTVPLYQIIDCFSTTNFYVPTGAGCTAWIHSTWVRYLHNHRAPVRKPGFNNVHLPQRSINIQTHAKRTKQSAIQVLCWALSCVTSSMAGPLAQPQPTSRPSANADPNNFIEQFPGGNQDIRVPFKFSTDAFVWKKNNSTLFSAALLS